MSDVAIQVKDLGKQFVIGNREALYRTFRETLMDMVTGPVRRLTQRRARNEKNSFWALRGVDFEIRQGEVVGVIGRNGAGKSTLLKVLSRIMEPTEGCAEIHGRVGSLLEVGTGFHPELTGRENIFLNGAILGMRKTEILKKFDEIVTFAEVERFIDTPVKHYSSGMYLRLAFAVAAHLEPEILLVDEVLAVGDASFQQKCLGRMEAVANEGRTVLFVSHNMAAVRALCTSGIVLDEGKVAMKGEVKDCIEVYYRSIGALQSSSDPLSPGKNGAVFGRLVVGGANGTTIGQTQPLEVSTQFRVDREAAGFDLYFYLQDMHGRLLFKAGLSSKSISLKQVGRGLYEVSLQAPPLWLTPGLYTIFFRIYFLDAKDSRKYESDKFPLDVMGTCSSNESLLHPPVEWQVQPSRSTTPAPATASIP